MTGLNQTINSLWSHSLSSRTIMCSIIQTLSDNEYLSILWITHQHTHMCLKHIVTEPGKLIYHKKAISM